MQHQISFAESQTDFNLESILAKEITRESLRETGLSGRELGKAYIFLFYLSNGAPTLEDAVYVRDLVHHLAGEDYKSRIGYLINSAFMFPTPHVFKAIKHLLDYHNIDDSVKSRRIGDNIVDIRLLKSLGAYKNVAHSIMHNVIITAKGRIPRDEDILSFYKKYFGRENLPINYSVLPHILRLGGYFHLGKKSIVLLEEYLHEKGLIAERLLHAKYG